ncbi:hypothetical protein BHM03_00043137 [Ensete ventricosum]|nr:hypothetical protein BHM03_00043137 [Ensete ventricosum]
MALTTEGNIGPAVEEGGERVLGGVEEGDGKDELRQLPGSRVGHGSLHHFPLQQPQERWNPSAQLQEQDSRVRVCRFGRWTGRNGRAHRSRGGGGGETQRKKQAFDCRIEVSIKSSPKLLGPD